MAGFEDNWAEEKQSAYLYRLISGIEAGTPREMLFRSLAEAADFQAGIWLKNILRDGGAEPPAYQPDFRTRAVASALRVIGPKMMAPVLSAMKVRGMSVYRVQAGPHDEMRHRSLTGGNNLRAAVFGINDGLLSNASLILGVAGASANPSFVLVGGVAGLLAGAFSMSAGEYVSVRSQRELFEYQIGLEREEIEKYPEEEAKELALIYEAKGILGPEAKRLADSIIADPKKALDTLSREELGLNPDELGSPWGAAIWSFMAFALGAFIPLIPFIFLHSLPQLMISIALTAVSLFSVGGVLSIFTGRNAFWSGLRMLLIGLGTGCLTYSIGHLMGVKI